MKVVSSNLTGPVVSIVQFGVSMLLEIAKALESSTEECLEDRIAISFSGGLDSSTLAAIAKKHADVHLFCAGTSSSADMVEAEKTAEDLKLPLTRCILQENQVLEMYESIYSFYPASPLKIEIGIPIFACCSQAAREGHKAILFGSASEELFVGYDRYYRYFEEGKDLDAMLREEFNHLGSGDIGMIRKIAYKCGLEARFPFHNQKLASLVFQIPLEERMAERELKKGVLREAAKMLGVPNRAIGRKKKAAQYGSGVHKIVIKNSEMLNAKFPAKLQ